ncbi:hypothetical protein E2C01_059461 [Portunus trituberculatus]|uniref:Uncharacterized protein n=1 Tax=Portunus trituberculatus TaxID=210409 RepID=A0A5B7H8F4_PORTR|nr:hypothetical protein [Portunus trituberculatus]
MLPTLKDCNQESKEQTQQAENLCTKHKQGMKSSNKESIQVKPVATDVTELTMVANTCNILEEEEHRGWRTCFSWLFRLFRRRRGRHSKKHLDSHDVAAQQSAACVMSLVNDVEDEKEVVKQEKSLTKMLSNDLLLCVMDVAEEQHEYMEAKSVEGRVVEEQREGRPVLSWAEEVTQAEEQGLDVFAPVSDALLDVLHHFAPATLTHSKVAISEHSHARNSANTTTPAARRRARRKVLAALRAKSEASTRNDKNMIIDAATTCKMCASLEEEDAAANTSSCKINPIPEAKGT